MRGVVLLLLALAACVLIASGNEESENKPWFCHGLDCPEYTVVTKHETFEERSYVATRWMTTNVEGSYMSAVFQGFMRLFNYIDGNNEAGEKIPMTAPVAVEMHPSGGKTGISNISISFFVPAKGNPPKAKDPTIYASNRPAGVVYVRSFDGFAMESDWNENAQALKDDLQAAGISFNPLSLIAAGYDPPFRFINRHNEIWLYGP